VRHSPALGRRTRRAPRSGVPLTVRTWPRLPPGQPGGPRRRGPAHRRPGALRVPEAVPRAAGPGRACTGWYRPRTGPRAGHPPMLTAGHKELADLSGCPARGPLSGGSPPGGAGSGAS
jgi:hypothetical protein